MTEETINPEEERQIMAAFNARQMRAARAKKAHPELVKKTVTPAEYQARLLKEIEADVKDEEIRKQNRLDRNWNSWRKHVPERFRDADTKEKSISTRVDLLRRGATHRTSVVLAGDLGVGKAQPVSEPVLTPLGFKRMGDITPGDFVIGRQGKAVRVEAVYPQGVRPVYKVTLSDGSFTYCDEEHLWSVNTDSSQDIWVTLTTKEILDKGADSDIKFKIPMVSPVSFDPQDEKLLLDPYLLGAVLAGGSIVDGKLCLSTDSIEAVQKIEEVLPEGVLLLDSPDEENMYVFAGLDFSFENNNVIFALQKYGIWEDVSFIKFIPEVYKQAAITERSSLLNGFLNVQSNEFVDQIELTDETVINDFIALVNSLGGTCTVYEEAEDRTLVRVDSVPERYIDTIAYSHYEETQCIQVSADDHLYITRNYIVTHNTWLAYAYLNNLVKEGIMSPANFVASTETAVLGRIAAGGFKRSEMYEDLRNPLKKVYFIDDVGQAFFSSDTGRREVWYELIDHIYSNDLTLILTTNKVLGSHSSGPRHTTLVDWMGDAAYDRLKHIMGPEGLITPSGANKRPAIYRERDVLHGKNQ